MIIDHFHIIKLIQFVLLASGREAEEENNINVDYLHSLVTFIKQYWSLVNVFFYIDYRSIKMNRISMFWKLL